MRKTRLTGTHNDKDKSGREHNSSFHSFVSLSVCALTVIAVTGGCKLAGTEKHKVYAASENESMYLPASGIVQGMRPVIGYNYGAGEHKRVKKIYFVTLGMSGVIMLIGTIICLTIPGQLIGMFTTNPQTIAAGKTALRIICAGFLISSVSVTACGALEGLGRGTASLIVSLCRYLVIILPAAFILSHFFGAVGVWNAFWIAEALTAGVSLLISKRVIGV